MRGVEWLTVGSIVLGAVGTYMMLPHRHGQAKPRNMHVAGFGLAVLSVLLLVGLWTPPGTFLSSLFFYAFAISAILAGILMVTSRDPIYSALWFAAVVLSTSGLFLLEGAQFLAAGTVIVYAGAIIVTFLFVIMLAQSHGQALYDRTSRTPARATMACFLLLWAVLYSLVTIQRTSSALDANGAVIMARDPLVPLGELATTVRITGMTDVSDVIDQAVRPETSRIRAAVGIETPPGVPAPHVAGLGATLYTDHLITLEIVGVILFVALVGAAAIATPRPPIRPPHSGR